MHRASSRRCTLIGPDVDLNKVAEQAATGGILGFYDFDENELVVRGDKTTPFVKTILVHELTHALQDQYFDIDRPELYDTDDDSGPRPRLGGRGRRHPGRGHVLPIAQRRRAAAGRRPARDHRRIDSPCDFPESIALLFSFPYEIGPMFMDALVPGGRQREDERRHATPPNSAEQLLHPERYLAGEQPVKVAKPAADGEEFDDGVMGELGMIILLREAMPMRAALQASEGWGGDQYVAYRTRARSASNSTWSWTPPGTTTRRSPRCDLGPPPRLGHRQDQGNDDRGYRL